MKAAAVAGPLLCLFFLAALALRRGAGLVIPLLALPLSHLVSLGTSLRLPDSRQTIFRRRKGGGSLEKRGRHRTVATLVYGLLSGEVKAVSDGEVSGLGLLLGLQDAALLALLSAYVCGKFQAIGETPPEVIIRSASPRPAQALAVRLNWLHSTLGSQC